MFSKILVSAFFILFSFQAAAVEVTQLGDLTDWDSFTKNVDSVDRANENAGLAYMISGAVVAIGGGIISHQSTDSLTNLTLSLIQSVGVGGIGYGASLFYLSDQNEMFRDTLSMQHDLTMAQKDEMVRNYLFLKKDREKKKRVIAAVTYGLIAALNVINATQATDNNLKPIYWALAGANLALSVSFSF